MALTPPPTTPVRTMSQAVFDACMAARMAWEVTHTAELTALQSDVTAKQEVATLAANTASGAASTADQKATIAATQAGLAATAAGQASGHRQAAESAAYVAGEHSATAANAAGSAIAAANSMPTAAAGGTADAITVSFTPAVVPAALRSVLVVFAAANATATPTIAVNGGTASPITARGGNTLLPGDIVGPGFVGLLMRNAANTAWELMNPGVVSSTLMHFAYDDRAQLSGVAGTDGACAFVEGLGMFRFMPASQAVVDGETCLAGTGGRWELKAADPDYVHTAIGREVDALEQAISAAKVLRGVFNMTTTSLAASSAVTFNCTVPGARVGDAGVVCPTYALTTGNVACFATVASDDLVTVTIRNFNNGAAATLTAAYWAVLVVKQP